MLPSRRKGTVKRTVYKLNIELPLNIDVAGFIFKILDILL